eukprot:PhM_4_TR13334/c1_g3_i5/m.17475
MLCLVWSVSAMDWADERWTVLQALCQTTVLDPTPWVIGPILSRSAAAQLHTATRRCRFRTEVAVVKRLDLLRVPCPDELSSNCQVPHASVAPLHRAPPRDPHGRAQRSTCSRTRHRAGPSGRWREQAQHSCRRILSLRVSATCSMPSCTFTA